MSGGLVTAAYIVAAILFIFSLAGLSKHETSQKGNNFGIAGMAIALIATIFGPDTGNVAWILVAMIIGGAIGIRLAKRVEMTEMPELVAILHSFVGLAAVLVGFNSYLYHEPGMEPILVNIHLTEVFLGIFIGAVTFTGSIVAFGKLRGKISSKPLMLPNRHKMNLAALVVSFLLLLVFVRTESVGLQVFALLIMTLIALAFGWRQPNASAIRVIISSAKTCRPTLSVRTKTSSSRKETTSAARFILWRFGSISGFEEILPRSLPKATIEPVKVTAPIKIPRNTSVRWMLTRIGSIPGSW